VVSHFDKVNLRRLFSLFFNAKSLQSQQGACFVHIVAGTVTDQLS